MTREQAIKIMEQRECCRECVVRDFTCKDCDEAFEMAIKALEQQTCEDAVNRAHVMLIVREFLNNSTYDEEMLVNDLNKLHSVQPETTVCEDAISREDALMALTGEWTESFTHIKEVFENE